MLAERKLPKIKYAESKSKKVLIDTYLQQRSVSFISDTHNLLFFGSDLQTVYRICRSEVIKYTEDLDKTVKESNIVEDLNLDRLLKPVKLTEKVMMTASYTIRKLEY